MLFDRAQVAAALPGYDLGDELGSGAFGVVVRALHRQLARPVAVKVVHVVDDEARRRFVAEARLLASIDHPHVVRVFDYVEADPLCLIVMELLDGGTLTRRRPTLSQEAACAVGLGVAAALSCAHAHGVLHRDVKPDNVLFGADGLLKTADFGIAKVFGGPDTTASMVAGTPRYMAPEQIVQGQLGPGTDLFALGVVLWELLAKRPFYDPALPLYELYGRTLNTNPEPLDGVPSPVERVVLRALSKDRGRRHQDAHSFALELALAATASFGTDWASRSGVRLRLDDDVRSAAGAGLGSNPGVSQTAKPAGRRAPQPVAGSGAAADPEADVAWRTDADAIARTGAAQARPSMSGSFSPAEPVGARHRRANPPGPAAPAAAPGSRPAAAPARPPDAPTPAPAPPAAAPPTDLPAAGRPPTAAPRSPHPPFDPMITLRGARPAAPAPRPAHGPEPPGHSSAVRSLAFSGDGRRLASASEDGLVLLWLVTDASMSPRQIGGLRPYNQLAAQVLALSDDGRLLATGREEHIQLWNLADPERPVQISELTTRSDIASLRFSGAPSSLWVVDRWPSVTAWDVQTSAGPGSVLRSYASTPQTGLTSADLSPDGRLVAFGSDHSDVSTWIVTRSQLRPAASLPATVTAEHVSYAADGRALAVSRLGELSLWEVSDLSAPRQRHTRPTGLARSAATFSRIGRLLAVPSGNGDLALLDAHDLERPVALTSVAGHGLATAFSSDGARLATTVANHGLRAWRIGRYRFANR